MRSRRTRTFSRSRGSRRRLAWAQRTVSASFTANNQWQTIDLLQEYKAATGATSAGATIMRTHLLVVPTALTGNDTFWIGLQIGDLNDIGGATTNALVPNPHDDPYLDWMFVSKYHADNSLFLGAAGIGAYGGVRLDLRSKRRMHQVQLAYTLCLYQDTVTTVAKTYDVHARTLLALP